MTFNLDVRWNLCVIWIVPNLITFAFKFLVLPWLWTQFYYVWWIKLFFLGLHWLHMFWKVKTQGFIGTKDPFQNYTRSYVRQNKFKKRKKTLNEGINTLKNHWFLPWPCKPLFGNPFFIHSIWGQIFNSNLNYKKEKMITKQIKIGCKRWKLKDGVGRWNNNISIFFNN